MKIIEKEGKKYIEGNIVILPTKSSNIGYRKEDVNTLYHRYKPLITSNNNTWQAVHLYFTSDEKIKEGDWFLNSMNNIFQADKSYIDNPAKERYFEHKKIIATTDKSLGTDLSSEFQKEHYIKEFNRLPQIPQQLIKDFVKAGGIDKVLIKIKPLMNTNESIPFNYRIETNSNNEVIIQLSKEKVWSKSDVFDFAFHTVQECKDMSDTELEAWITKNI